MEDGVHTTEGAFLTFTKGVPCFSTGLTRGLKRKVDHSTAVHFTEGSTAGMRSGRAQTFTLPRLAPNTR